MADIRTPGRNEPLSDANRVASQRVTDWMQSVSKLSILEGDGSPAGVVIADLLRFYWDRVGEDLYFKTTQGGTGGWKQVQLI